MRPRASPAAQGSGTKLKKRKSLQNPPTPPVSSRIRGINVEIVARRCSSTSEMKYLLLKVEKRCQTTIEKILKSIVDERRSPNPLAERIYVRAPLLSQTLARQLWAAPRSRWVENEVDMRFASFIDGRIGSAGCQAVQTCCVWWGCL